MGKETTIKHKDGGVTTVKENPDKTNTVTHSDDSKYTNVGAGHTHDEVVKEHTTEGAKVTQKGN